MERSFIGKLQTWANARDRHPLIIRGMRQVGKTWCVRTFGETAFNGDMVIIDFEYSDRFAAVFNDDFDVSRIVAELEALSGHRIVKGQTLLFFDEIQLCPRAVESLRYFYERMPGLHVVAAGSLLDFVLKDISFPVGRVAFLDLQPMSFAEFLRAEGRRGLADQIEGDIAPLGRAIHEELLKELRVYMRVGGMPKAVEAWTTDRSYVEVRKTQDMILDSFRQDFGKYRPRVEPQALSAVFDTVAASVGRQIVFARLASEFSGTTNKKALELLETARLIRIVRSASAAGAPLLPATKDRIKTILGDIGLMQAAAKSPICEDRAGEDLLSLYRGALAEQFVGQELVAADPSRRLCWWSREAKNSTAEVDYLVESGGRVQPVEVKSGAAGRLRSLHQLLSEHSTCRDGIVFSESEPGVLPEQRLRFLPLYFASRI